ncbi:hypothetical protein NDU88_004171, partial [Pleurodeles waltl]
APHNLSLVTYADDTQLVVSLSSSGDSPVTNLSRCMSDIAKWMTKSKLKFNDGKSEVLVLGNGPPPLPLPSLSDAFSTLSPPKSQVKTLGVMLDPRLTMDSQASKVSSTCFGLMRMFRKILSLLPPTARRILIQALILSRLDYGNSLFLSSPFYVIKKLQRVQNAAARLLTHSSKYSSAKLAISTLHWLPIKERIHFKSLC